MSELKREAFEKHNLIPSDAEFCDKHQMYKHKQYRGVIEHPINELWESFCDGAQWQARTQKAIVTEVERWKNAAHDQAETISELQELVHCQRQASAVVPAKYHRRLVEALRFCVSVMCDGSRFVSYSQQKSAAQDVRAILAELEKEPTQ
jgi:hypothetical protein